MNLRKDHCIIDSRSSRAAQARARRRKERKGFGGEKERGSRLALSLPLSLFLSLSLSALCLPARVRPALARPREALAGGVGRFRPVPNSARNPPFLFDRTKTKPENQPSDRATRELRESGVRTHKPRTTLNDGCLGSRIDEERSEPRYVV